MSLEKLERNNRRLDAAAQTATPNKTHPGSGAMQAGAGGTDTASREYAEQLTARFQAYVDWAIANWPLGGQSSGRSDQPLTQAAFDRSRDDLVAICRQAGAPVDGEVDPSVPGGAQFMPVTPMPWP
jgi:hypothetical protein